MDPNNKHCRRSSSPSSPSSPITNPVLWPDSDDEDNPDFYPQSQSLHQLLHHPEPLKCPKQNQQHDDVAEAGLNERPTTPTNKRHAETWTGSPSSTPVRNRRRVELAENPAMSLAEHLRAEIDRAIENGIDHIDFSNLSLSEIPREIGELQHVTVLSQDRISNCSLKLFLSANALTSICPELFHLQNLSVLSLRNNNLTNLPPEIGLLHNLVEFSIGNNQLQFLPSEILNLRKLNIIALTPNPFLLWETILSSLSTSIEDSNSHSGTRNEELTQSSPNLSPQLPPYRRIINSFSPPSLAEFASRRILADNVSYAKDELPEVLAMQLQQAERANICPNPRCRGRFVTAEVEELLWIRSLHNEIVPLLFRWCHIACRHSIEVSGLPNLSDLSRYMTMTCLGEPVILSVHG